MESDIPRYDLTVDYIVGEGFGYGNVKAYSPRDVGLTC